MIALGSILNRPPKLLFFSSQRNSALLSYRTPHQLIKMALASQPLNIFNNQAMPLTQTGVNFLPQFSAPYKEGVSYTSEFFILKLE